MVILPETSNHKIFWGSIIVTDNDKTRSYSLEWKRIYKENVHIYDNGIVT